MRWGQNDRQTRQTDKTDRPKKGEGTPRKTPPTCAKWPTKMACLAATPFCVCGASRSSQLWGRHMGLQPATTAGRAEARAPGLPILGSPGGQKALEPHSRPRRGRGIRKSVAAPNTKKNKKTTRDRERERERDRERKRGKQRASGQPNPETQERPHNGGARPQKKPGATRRPQKRKADFSRPRQNAARFERKNGTQTQKEEDKPS